MTRFRTRQTRRGFTLVEILVGLAIISTLFAIGAPVALRAVRTAKVSSVGYNCNSLVRKAKSEAIKKNSPVVVQYDAAEKLLIGFVDVHGETVDDPPDFAFGPLGGLPPTATDHEVSRCSLPSGMEWGGPESDPSITVGFTLIDTKRLAILDPDGSIRDIGTFRFGDGLGNYLAIQVAPVATARVTLLKWDEETAKWRQQGEEGKKWEWF